MNYRILEIHWTHIIKISQFTVTFFLLEEKGKITYIRNYSLKLWDHFFPILSPIIKDFRCNHWSVGNHEPVTKLISADHRSYIIVKFSSTCFSPFEMYLKGQKDSVPQSSLVIVRSIYCTYLSSYTRCTVFNEKFFK